MQFLRLRVRSNGSSSVDSSRNVTVVLGSNNVRSLGWQGHPPDPQAVLLLGVSFCC
jgi:hypothetical protein